MVLVDLESDTNNQGGPILGVNIVEIQKNEREMASTFIALWYEPKPMKILHKRYNWKIFTKIVCRRNESGIPIIALSIDGGQG